MVLFGWKEGSGTILIILITNKMRIMMQLPAVKQLLRKGSSSFSNFLKDSPLTLEHVASRTKKRNSPPSKHDFNTAHSSSAASPVSSSLIHNSKHNEIKTLALLSQAINKPILVKPTYNLRSDQVDPQTQIENSIAFMKYLDHSLEKASAIEVVMMVQDYYRHNQAKKQASTFRGLLKNKLMGTEGEQILSESLFDSIRHHLNHNLNFFSENVTENSDFINSLFKILSEADLSYITVDRFEEECFTPGEEQKVMTTGKQYFEACSQKYFEKEAEPVLEEKTEAQKYKAALEEAFQLNESTKFSKLHLKKVVEKSTSNEEKLQVATELVVFRKKNVNKTMMNEETMKNDLKCAYLYDLPFSITEDEAKQFTEFIEVTKGVKIERFQLFSYKKFIDRTHQDFTFRVPDQYQKKNAPIEKIVKNVDIDELTKHTPSENKKKPKYSSRSKSKAKLASDDVPLQNEPARMKSVTDALLLKIKKENYSKFNKSCMLIEFASEQDKQAVLSQDARLYGLNFKFFKNVKFEEGYCKTTISLSGFPWGCSSKELERHLNNTLEPARIPVRVDESCILTKNNIVIQFDYLSEARLAIQLLDRTSFQNKTLKASLSYGPCKLFNKQYSATSESTYEKLKLKIQELGSYYEKRYEGDGRKAKE